nr:DegV family protein [Lachnospiraceae bacterium]
EGVQPENLVKELEGVKLRIRTSFIVDNTSYLARTGRVSQGLNAVSNAFMLHPVLRLKDGMMKVGNIMIGTRDSAWEKYISGVLDKSSNADRKLLILECSGLSISEKELIVEKVKKISHFEDIIIHNVSPTISINCGPHTFGLIYMTK